MPPMPRRIAALLALAALGATATAAAGCGAGDPPPLDARCTESPGVIERALARAPQPVTLASGTRLSECVSHARSDADLQTAGAVLTRAADDLASRARRGDTGAALGLGYLVGAARRGAKRTAGIHAELQRRVESSARVVVDTGAGPVADALERGIRAGEATG
jgi:hypothetical protein